MAKDISSKGQGPNTLNEDMMAHHNMDWNKAEGQRTSSQFPCPVSLAVSTASLHQLQTPMTGRYIAQLKHIL